MGSLARSLSKILAVAGLTVAASVIAPAPASATVMIPLSIEDLTANSTAVVRGRVVSSEALWDEQHQRIYTHTVIEVLDPIHATNALPKQITIRTLGGEVGDIGMKVAGVEKFSTDEEVVLFVRPDPIVPATFQTIGMSQGKFRIEHESSGRAIAVPSVDGIAFVRPQAEGGPMKVDPSTPRPDRIPLAELKERVAAAVAKQRTLPAQPTKPSTTPAFGTGNK